MVSDKFRPGEQKHPETKQAERLEKGQDVLKAEKKDVKFSSHTIKSGENLTKISQKYGIPLKALYAVNQHELDPKIMVKDGKVAYGAPTYHVGDKLNIPSQADVPNAVKYFDAWTKSIVAKQQLEKPDVTAKPDQPTIKSQEKPKLQTQVAGDKKTPGRTDQLIPSEIVEAAKRAAGQYGRDVTIDKAMYAAQRETAGEIDKGIDAAWNILDKSNLLGEKFGSAHIDYQFMAKESNQKNLQHAADVLAQNPTEKNAKQFAKMFSLVTGKSFNPTDFVSQYAKPGHLALPELSEHYRKSLEQGKAAVEITAAVGLAATTVIPGVGEVTGPLAARIALKYGTAAIAGAVGAEVVHLANKGSVKDLPGVMARGGVAGATVPFAATIGLGAEGAATSGLLRLPASAIARSEAVNAAGQTATQIGLGGRMIGSSFGTGVGVGAVGGILEGGSAAAEDAKKGKVDVPHVVNASVHGAVIGFGAGSALGLAGPLVADSAAALKSVAAKSAEAPIADTVAGTTAARLESEAAAALTAQGKTAPGTEVIGKGAPPAKEMPTVQQPDLPKQVPQGDVSKSTTQPQTDVPNAAQAFNKTAELPQPVPTKITTQQPTDVAKTTQTDLSKGTQPTDVSKGAVSSPPADASKTATSTSDMSKGTTPQIDAKTIPGDWSKQVPPLEKKTGDFPTSKIDSPKTTKTFPKPPTDAKPTPTQSTGDASKTSSGDWNKGSTLDVTPQQKQAKPAEVTKSISPEEAWQKKMDKLAKDPLVKDLKPLELKDGWQGVEYQRKIGGRTVQESYNPKDGSKVFTEEYKDGAGVPHREVTTTSANGQEVTNKFRIRQGADGKQELIPVSNKWESHLAELRRDRSISNLEEIPMGNNWNKVRYDKANGRQVEEAVRNTDGARYLKEEFIDHRGVPNREVSTTTADGHTTTNRFKLDQNGQWKHLGKTRAGEAPEANSAETASMPPSGAQKWAKETIEAGNKWALDKLKSLGSDTHIANVKEVNLKQGWKAVEYTDAAGAKITEAYNPTTGAKHTIKSYTEKAVRYQEDTLEVPKDNYKLWQKQKQVETSRSRMRRQDDDSIAPEYEWETVDSTHHHNAKEQAAKLKTPTE